MFNVGPPPGQPSSGPPQGAASGETPSTPRKKMGVRAGVYRIKTGLIRAVAGPEKKKTEKKSKKEKTGQKPTNTNAPVGAMPTPLTPDDHNYIAYLHGQQPTIQPPVQQLQAIAATQNSLTMSQPPASHAPPPQSTVLSASLPPEKTTDDGWDSRINSALGTVIEKLAYGKDAYLAFDDLRTIAREKKRWDSKNLTRWVRDMTADCTFEELVTIHKNAATLPDTYLSNSFRREIARIVVPRLFIRKIIDAENVEELDRAIASCCRPYNEEYRPPRDGELEEMLPQMFKDAIECELLTPNQLYTMKVTMPHYSDCRCIRSLDVLLDTKYGGVIKEEEDRLLGQLVQRSNAGLFGANI
jgi:hypothetical protein